MCCLSSSMVPYPSKNSHPSTNSSISFSLSLFFIFSIKLLKILHFLNIILFLFTLFVISFDTRLSKKNHRLVEILPRLSSKAKKDAMKEACSQHRRDFSKLKNFVNNFPQSLKGEGLALT